MPPVSSLKQIKFVCTGIDSIINDFSACRSPCSLETSVKGISIGSTSDKTFDQWVHTGREITIRKCAPDSTVAVRYLRHPNVSNSW